MRVLRICVLVLFVMVTLTSSVFFVRDLIQRDDSIPKIGMDSSLLEISVQDDESVLLSDVIAYDEKDGDLTDHVVIESISSFLVPGECNVRYAVCDKNNHVASAERRIRYTDYTAPTFYLRRSLCFSSMEKADILPCLGVKDVIDGDISENIIISSSDYMADEPGIYRIQCQATNSKGDTIELQLPVYVENRSFSAPIIVLQKYLTYMKVGDTLDFRKLVIGVADAEGEELRNVKLTYDSGLRAQKPGVYSIHYYAQELDEYGEVLPDAPRGHAVLIVIVEEE